MSTNFQDLEPDSPEYEAALEAAQNAEEDALTAAATADKGAGDNGEGNGATQGNAATDTAAADAVAAAEAAATQAAADEAAGAEAANAQTTTKATGVLGKDGKTVLPYAALHASRNAAKQHRLRAEEAERKLAERDQQIEDLKAGKKPDSTAADLEGMTAKELEELATDFPQMAPLVKLAQAAIKRVADLEKKGAPVVAEKTTATEQHEEGETVDDAIDANPALLEWMSDPQHADKFKRAQVLDRALEDSPKWKDKPMAERFAHVVGLVADEFDIELGQGAVYQGAAPPAPQKTTPKTTSKADTQAAIQKATRTEPNTLSDFKGGAVDQTEQRIESMPAQRMLNRMLAMSDEDIDASLARLG
jgi:hypothetical protein